AGRDTAATLDRAPGIGPAARNVKRAVECELAFARHERGLRACCGEFNWPYAKPIDDGVGEDRRWAGPAGDVHDQHEVVRAVGRRKGKDVRYVGGRISERSGPGEVVGHGRLVPYELDLAFERLAIALTV